MERAESVLSTNKLSKSYGKVVALKELDLDVGRGEIYGFLGPNGAGKTTAIRLLLNFIRPTSGTASVLGYDSRKQSVQLRRHVGYLPGELSLYENLSARQLFGYSASQYGVKDLGYAMELAERLRVSDLDQKIGKLSQGNKQKVGLVLALLHRPDLAILDEPTNALDPLIRHELYAILEEARERGMTVFFSSHVLAEAERICDRVAIIRDGELTRVGTVEELKAIARRRVRVSFADGIPLEELERVEGVSDVRALDAHTAELMVREHVDELVRTVAHYPLTDLYSEDLSLEEIFLGYYESPNGAGAANGYRNGNGRNRRNGTDHTAATDVAHRDDRVGADGLVSETPVPPEQETAERPG